MGLLESSFNFFNIIILLGILHGLIFSAIVIVNKKYRSKSSLYIAFTILALSFSTLQYILLDVEFIKDNSIWYDFRIPFEFLILPMFFLFVNYYLQKTVSRVVKCFLFFPFLVGLIFSVIIYQIPKSNEWYVYLSVFLEYMSMIFTLGLIILIFVKVIIYEKNGLKIGNDNIRVQTKWLKRILIIGLVMCLVWFVIITLMQSKSIKGFILYYPLWIGISFLIYWIAYASISHLKVYVDRNEIRNQQKSNIELKESPKVKVKTNNKFEEINEIVISEKLYLNSNISLKHLSKKCSLSENYLSQLINKNSNYNFNDYINNYRIDTAKKMLSNIDYDNYTITSIGLESGFNSKSSFYSAFKKFTTITPVQYKKSVRNL
jgi:AraC-like DNA-binding protein